ncbi:hypothetical protein NDU88_000292 [Pleurodeles waltl]|uniref:Secreted protein n=1 Tax=Pleurodeles waltl TaxID=8319 RepID=A0AAV7VVM3_PLEWA|nr:hypothetical protein NDU88_000292 [Pleurodeles waltl]
MRARRAARGSVVSLVTCARIAARDSNGYPLARHASKTVLLLKKNDEGHDLKSTKATGRRINNVLRNPAWTRPHGNPAWTLVMSRRSHHT